MFPVMDMAIFGLLVGLWPFPIVVNLCPTQRSAHVGSGVGVVGPATAGIVRPSATPNTIRLQKNLVNRFISVISPASALDPEPPNTQMQS